MLPRVIKAFVSSHRMSKRNLIQVEIQRDPRFMQVTAADVAHFQSIVGESGVITKEDELKPFNIDWMGRYSGRATVALKPKTTEAVSKIMAHCNANRLAVVPQGGNTGLVGGSVPVFDEVVLSTTDMTQIEDFDSDSGVVVTQAGVILEKLDAHVGAQGYRVPLDFGAKHSCRIGGNVATNAGGTRFIRYGSLRGTVLGIEAVLPDGRIMDTLTTLPKDNTGYDLKQLMIGGEGTLGVITKVAIQCAILPASIETLVLRAGSFDNVKKLLRMAKHGLGETLSAFEYMDAMCSELAAIYLPHVTDPLADDDGAYNDDAGAGSVLIEVAGSDTEHNKQKLHRYLQKALESGLVSKGVIAENSTQSQVMWKFRESMAKAVHNAGCGGVLKYDVSVPLSHFYKMVRESRNRVQDIDNVRVVGWGHIGDCNLHLNVAIGEGVDSKKVQERMEPWVYEFVHACRGSVSAEHGLGVMKAGAIGYSKGEVAVDMMRVVKQGLDEHGICNPYKMLPGREG